MAEPERRIVEDLPVNLSFDDIAERLLLEEEEDRELMRARCAVAAALARPKGIYTVRPVAAIEGEQVTIGGSVFRSRVLAGNLQGVQQVRAYVGTCLMPPLFGLLAQHISASLLPAYLLVILVLMAVMHESLIRKIAKTKQAA